MIRINCLKAYYIVLILFLAQNERSLGDPSDQRFPNQTSSTVRSSKANPRKNDKEDSQCNGGTNLDLKKKKKMIPLELGFLSHSMSTIYCDFDITDCDVVLCYNAKWTSGSQRYSWNSYKPRVDYTEGDSDGKYIYMDASSLPSVGDVCYFMKPVSVPHTDYRPYCVEFAYDTSGNAGFTALVGVVSYTNDLDYEYVDKVSDWVRVRYNWKLNSDADYLIWRAKAVAKPVRGGYAVDAVRIYSGRCSGSWNSWSSWSSCSVTCDEGVRRRSRTCSSSSCRGSSSQLKDCYKPSCPEWSSYSEWSACSVTCGVGTRKRSRSCSGGNCSGPDSETKSCDEGPCVEWTSYSAWSPCSVTCGQGTQRRSRSCSGTNCPGSDSQTQSCDMARCAADWSPWSTWSYCSVTCSLGTRRRSRRCLGSGCSGSNEETQKCYEGECPVWSSWSDCSATCNNGTRRRTRTCPNGRCSGSDTETQQCWAGTCATLAERWSSWGKWSLCSVTCDRGSRRRSRQCSGSSCSGSNDETQMCYTGRCTAVAQWSSWGTWSLCSVTCDEGSRRRSRQCSGSGCPGSSEERQMCYAGACQGWSAWSPWNTCSRSCGGGEQSRWRSCAASVTCQGNYRQRKPCNQNACQEREESKWSEWGSWSDCDTTCGPGSKSRGRYCLSSVTCSGPYSQYGVCNNGDCSGRTCGNIAIAPIFTHGARIVGGEEAKAHSWPWQARVMRTDNSNYLCGGTIISQQYILTSAHCVQENVPVTSLRVVLGDHSVRAKETAERTIEVDRVTRHHFYWLTRQIHRNDIALLKLKQDITYGKEVSPACLPEEEVRADTNCVTTGWGLTRDASADRDRLRQVTVRVIPHNICKRAEYYGNRIYDEMLCAGYPNGGRDSCQGDSGGPLVCQDASSQRWVLHGVTSWGDDCAAPNKPGVYTRVTSYRSWIKENAGI